MIVGMRLALRDAGQADAMKMVRVKYREVVNLRVAVGLALFATIYTACLHALALTLDVSVEEILPATGAFCVTLWIFGMLWIAYRRWREVAIPESDLEHILSEINPDCCIVINENRQITMCSGSIDIMFGYSAKEVLGQTTELLYFDRRPAPNPELHHIHDQLNRVGFHVGLAKGRHRDGRIIPLEIITGSLRKRRGAVLLLRDISKRVAAEEAHHAKAELLRQLEENFEKLKKVEKARDNLLHMIVHDMKNPLQVILSTMQLLREELKPVASEASHTYMDESLIQTQRLIELVNSLLDISRLESGDMPLHLAECDLRVAVRRATSSIGLLAGSRSIQDYLPADPVQVTCDSEIINRVLVNLVSNAIFHTPDGTRISVSVTPGDVHARVEVTDNGPGISPAEQDHIFEKFAAPRVAKHRSNHNSTGLGLPFCKLAIEAHGGRIGIDSLPGRGTTFWLLIPIHPQATLSPNAEQQTADR